MSKKILEIVETIDRRMIEMTKEEFIEIINPLRILSEKSCKFLKTALEANFDKYLENKLKSKVVIGICVKHIEDKEFGSSYCTNCGNHRIDH